MKYLILLSIFICGCNGSSDFEKGKPLPKFHYMDKVIIYKGFYQYCTGIVVNPLMYELETYLYRIDSKNCDIPYNIRVEESHIVLISRNKENK